MLKDGSGWIHLRDRFGGCERTLETEVFFNRCDGDSPDFESS